jgi:hypothetical protein
VPTIRFGVAYPQSVIGGAPDTVGSFAQAVEADGLAHLAPGGWVVPRSGVRPRRLTYFTGGRRDGRTVATPSLLDPVTAAMSRSAACLTPCPAWAWRPS